MFYAEEYPRHLWATDLTKSLERVLIVHRLREVSALVGYTRFDYLSPDIDGEYDVNLQVARLGVNANWIPAIENKGEGLFLQFNKDAVDQWRARPKVEAQEQKLERAGCDNGASNRTSRSGHFSARRTSCFIRSRIF